MPSPERVRGWQNATAYTLMKNKGKFEIVSPYRDRWKDFTEELKRLAGVIGVNSLAGKRALVVGPGRSQEEASLLLALPDIAEVCLVEWHPANFDYLARRVAALEKELPEFEKVKVFLADAVYMEGVDNGSVELVYMRDVIEHVENIEGQAYPQAVPQKVKDIFREIKRVLATGGYLFTPGLEVKPNLEKELWQIGLVRVQDDIWRKVA